MPNQLTRTQVENHLRALEQRGIRRVEVIDLAGALRADVRDLVPILEELAREGHLTRRQ